MNIGGVPVTKCEEVLVLPRKTREEDIPITARAVESMDDFDGMCPKPATPMAITSKGKVPRETENFLKDIGAWSEKRHAYICVKSLEPSNITWDEVDLSKPATWVKWSDELTKAGLSDVEVQRVQVLVLEANALSDAKLKEAREHFLHGQATAE